MIKRFLLTLIVLAVIFGGLFGYKAYKGYVNRQMMAHFKFPPATVSVTAAKKVKWSPDIKTIGSILSPESVDVTTQIPGQISAIYFKSGEYVQKGILLASLDDSTQVAQLKQYKSQLIINRFNYLQYKKAYLKNAVSKAVFIQMKSALLQNKALIQQTQTVINDMHIKAPFTGILGIRDSSSANLGQYINPGTKIISLYSINPVYADFSLPQNDLGKLRIGQRVSIESDSFPGKQFIGKVRSISVNVNNVSRNITVRTTVPNNGLLLRPGMFVTGNILLPELNNVITVPSTALSYNPYGDFVYVAEKIKEGYIAKAVYVVAGSEKNGMTVITKGLKAGQLVVTAGQVKLRNGMPIVFKTPGKNVKSISGLKSKTATGIGR